MIRSAALGGLFIGVLSALPIIGMANCCCCLWVVSGGALAAYLQVQQENRTLTAGEGAGVGALAGVIGAFVWLPIALLLGAMMAPLQEAMLEQMRNTRDLPPEARDVLESLGGGTGVAASFFMFFLYLVIGAIVAALGGVLAAAYFKKEVPPALGGDWVPPLPPQQ